VEFFVELPNSAPNIHYIDPQIYVCEGDYLSYLFNVTDEDEQTPSPSINPSAPTSPFYITFYRSYNYTLKTYEIFSGIILKYHFGGINVGNRTFEENVSVSDGQNVDSRKTNITLIEINNPPSVDSVGTQTIWGVGENNTFIYQLSGVDIEDGNISLGNLSLGIIIRNSSDAIVPLFNISPTGWMIYTANQSELGIYRVWINATDNGLQVYDAGITSYCGETPDNKSSEINFTLTVTDENRPPYITSHYPEDDNLTVYEGASLYFNVTMHDPDLSPVDAYWYYEDALVKYDPGFDIGNFSELSYTFSYSSSGNRTIRVNVTDGNLTYSYDSFQWNISVIDVPIPVSPPSGGGGGGGGALICLEKWGCSDWNDCKNAKDSLGFFLLTSEEYSNITEECDSSLWSDVYCGFQIRECEDVNHCNSTKNKPSEMQACYYTENPNCEDGIRNCHDGGCEILIDCGGPCKDCPTCSDNIQNQGEEGVDCGGPCRPCEVERPLVEGSILRYILIFITLILLIVFIIITIRYLRLNSLRKRYSLTSKQAAGQTSKTEKFK